MPSPTIRKMQRWAEGRLPTDPGLGSGCVQEDVLLSTRTESASGELIMGLSVSVWIGLGSSPLAVHCPLGRTARELADTNRLQTTQRTHGRAENACGSQGRTQPVTEFGATISRRSFLISIGLSGLQAPFGTLAQPAGGRLGSAVSRTSRETLRWSGLSGSWSWRTPATRHTRADEGDRRSCAGEEAPERSRGGQHVPRRPGGLRRDGEPTSGRRHRAGRSTLYSRRARGRPARSRSLVVTP
jgi:hypothetical protein